jgi:hypothetical protein
VPATALALVAALRHCSRASRRKGLRRDIHHWRRLIDLPFGVERIPFACDDEPIDSNCIELAPSTIPAQIRRNVYLQEYTRISLIMQPERDNSRAFYVQRA